MGLVHPAGGSRGLGISTQAQVKINNRIGQTQLLITEVWWQDFDPGMWSWVNILCMWYFKTEGLKCDAHMNLGLWQCCVVLCQRRFLTQDPYSWKRKAVPSAAKCSAFPGTWAPNGAGMGMYTLDIPLAAGGSAGAISGLGGALVHQHLSHILSCESRGCGHGIRHMLYRSSGPGAVQCCCKDFVSAKWTLGGVSQCCFCFQQSSQQLRASG